MEGKELFAVVNSALNGLSAVLLATGYVLIRSGRWRAHAATMSAALLSSAIFLACYLYSKFAYGEISSGIPRGWYLAAYLVVLIPHVALAVLMLPLIFMTIWLAATRQWQRHRKFARPTLGIWLYVSVTGVLIYFMLYQWYPALYPDAYRASELFKVAPK
ncbi:MAG TPA: DUF420 domain-containing protein [Tepidisphaeraceae bacterium]